jgi:hypoxanthine phosphoribosyltransferase
LLVDEVYDSDETIEFARKLLENLGAKRVVTAAVHYKPTRAVTGKAPDFYAEETAAWIHYPWKSLELPAKEDGEKVYSAR